MLSSSVDAGLFSEGDLAGFAFGSQYPNMKEEYIKCIFGNSDFEETCYATSEYQCTGVGDCIIKVRGLEGSRLTWRTTCNDYQFSYTTFEGKDKEIPFECDNYIGDLVTCVFSDSETEKICTSEYGSCEGVGSCTINFNAPEGKRILWTACGDRAYTTQGNGDSIIFECGNVVSERDICLFEGPGSHYCLSDYGSCSGNSRCIADVYGQRDERVKWTNSEAFSGYSLLDGKNEYVSFTDSLDSTSEGVTCIFPDAEHEYYCTSSGFSCDNYERDTGSVLNSCSVEVIAENGKQLTWTSNVPESIPKITRMDGSDETIYFTIDTEICDNKIDDDHDGKIDCEDSGCYDYVDNELGVQCKAGRWGEYICNDFPVEGGMVIGIKGIDNDGDGYPNCADVEDCGEQEYCIYPEKVIDEYPNACRDEFDNDGDNLIDDAEVECREPSFVVRPTNHEGVPGDEIYLIGNNIVGDTKNIDFTWGDSIVVEMGEDGDFEIPYTIPEVESGNYEIELEDYGNLIVQFFVLKEFDEEFIVRPLHGFPEQEINLAMNNFEEGIYTIVFDETLLLTVEIGKSGSFTGNFIVPDVIGGVHVIEILSYPKLRQNFIVDEVEGPVVEVVTCVFDGGDQFENVCESSYGSCSGHESCDVTVKGSGSEETVIVWTSTIPDSETQITTLDGVDENISFVAPVYDVANWECVDGYSIEAESPISLTEQQWSSYYIDPVCNNNHSGKLNYELEEPIESFIGEAFRAIEDLTVPERITCVFKKLNENIDTCYTTLGKCEGINDCYFDVKSEKGTIIDVKSSVVNSGVKRVLVDGQDEILIFSEVSEIVTDNIRCEFISMENEIQMCYSEFGSCKGTNSCDVDVEGPYSYPLNWDSTVVGAAKIETTILGNAKILQFVEHKQEISIGPEIIIPVEPEEEIEISTEEEIEISTEEEIEISTEEEIEIFIEEGAPIEPDVIEPVPSNQSEEIIPPEQSSGDQEEVVEPDQQQEEMPPEYSEYSWECVDEFEVSFASYPIPMSKIWWESEAEFLCALQGSSVYGVAQEPIPPAQFEPAQTPITGNVAYGPQTYSGWVFYQLGILG